LQANPPNKKARPNFIGLAVQSDQNKFPKKLLSIESGESITQFFRIQRVCSKFGDLNLLGLPPGWGMEKNSVVGA
jgi:hypothetical protein